MSFQFPFKKKLTQPHAAPRNAATHAAYVIDSCWLVFCCRCMQALDVGHRLIRMGPPSNDNGNGYGAVLLRHLWLSETPRLSSGARMTHGTLLRHASLVMTTLDRFVQAQAPLYATVCAELAAGRKATHWMWFIFPQLQALGRSATARHFGLESLSEAQAYWRHPLLGPRLKECTDLVLAISGHSAHDIFGSPDDLKLRSCLTLFNPVALPDQTFARALEKFFAGQGDPLTLALLASLA